jgi:hypothetical protein
MDPCERASLLPAPHQVLALEFARCADDSLLLSGRKSRGKFGLDNFAPVQPEFSEPRFNVAPTQRIVVIPTRDMRREARRMRWGFIRAGRRRPRSDRVGSILATNDCALRGVPAKAVAA